MGGSCFLEPSMGAGWEGSARFQEDSFGLITKAGAETGQRGRSARLLGLGERERLPGGEWWPRWWPG